jgi:hypothetical protein
MKSPSLESKMDLLNLSSSPCLTNTSPQTELETDFLNVNANKGTQRNETSRTNLVDISDNMDFGMSTSSAPFKDENNLSGSGQNFDLLGDLNVFSTQSAQPITKSATATSNRQNDLFDPFSTQSSESRVRVKLTFYVYKDLHGFIVIFFLL